MADEIAVRIVEIVEYEESLHREALLDAIVQLQEHERVFDPRLLPGQAMAKEYLSLLQERCDLYQGQILLAMLGQAVVGFVCVMATVPPTDPDDPRGDSAYISDLFVEASYRRQGIGRRLLQEAEASAQSRGATLIRVGVLAGNLRARRLYEELGFVPYHIQLVKPLSSRTARPE
ncbi:MAG: GNAT family N-acetyltransferase [Cyanobacteriota bacterium]